MTEVSAPTVFRLKTLRSEGDERREATNPRASCYSKHFVLSRKATEGAEVFWHRAASYLCP